MAACEVAERCPEFEFNASAPEFFPWHSPWKTPQPRPRQQLHQRVSTSAGPRTGSPICGPGLEGDSASKGRLPGEDAQRRSRRGRKAEMRQNGSVGISLSAAIPVLGCADEPVEKVPAALIAAAPPPPGLGLRLDAGIAELGGKMGGGGGGTGGGGGARGIAKHEDADEAPPTSPEYGASDAGATSRRRRSTSSLEAPGQVSTLVVKNLAQDLEKDSLVRYLVERNIPPWDVELHLDAGGVFRGTAFVRYSTPQEATVALETLGASTDLAGRRVRIEMQKSKSLIGRRSLEAELPQEELVIVRIEIERFLWESSLPEIRLPTTFNVQQRKYAHSLAERHNLSHVTSQGENGDKYVLLSKDRRTQQQDGCSKGRTKAFSTFDEEMEGSLMQVAKGLVKLGRKKKGRTPQLSPSSAPSPARLALLSPASAPTPTVVGLSPAFLPRVPPMLLPPGLDPGIHGFVLPPPGLWSLGEADFWPAPQDDDTVENCKDPPSVHDTTAEFDAEVEKSSLESSTEATEEAESVPGSIGKTLR
eukprot:TRINITY_DN19553_c0_g1_i1.p1 TRINITY_DN19553_c0_g1~~TRINITY_DN19553_c0_g1_i1.p1  ORF type:complete len:532 (-),score=113.18 TRINITY_DN19553_c0_g1_i1:386-1981(-)